MQEADANELPGTMADTWTDLSSLLNFHSPFRSREVGVSSTPAEVLCWVSMVGLF